MSSRRSGRAEALGLDPTARNGLVAAAGGSAAAPPPPDAWTGSALGSVTFTGTMMLGMTSMLVGQADVAKSGSTPTRPRPTTAGTPRAMPSEDEDRAAC